MNFDFTEDQLALRDTVRKWVQKDYGFEHRRAIARAGAFSGEIWHALSELGLLGLLIPEEHGGLDLGPIEAMVVMEEFGRALLLEPYAQGGLIAPHLLVQAPQPLRQRLLPEIAAGETLVVLAHQEPAARYRLAHVTTRAALAGDGWKISGVKSNVPAASHAHALLVPARVMGAADDEDGVALFLVECGSAAPPVRPAVTLDGTAAAEVVFDDTPAQLVLQAGPGPGGAFGLLERAIDIGIAALCAEGVGTMESLLTLTTEYLNTRKQFGVPIGSFQVLRHRIADMKLQLELARSMSYLASLKLAQPAAERRRFLSQAKLQLGRSMRYVGQQSLQLHGAMGLTDEYIASHYFRRLTALEMTFGDSFHHLGEASRRMDMAAGVYLTAGVD